MNRVEMLESRTMRAVDLSFRDQVNAGGVFKAGQDISVPLHWLFAGEPTEPKHTFAIEMRMAPHSFLTAGNLADFNDPSAITVGTVNTETTVLGDTLFTAKLPATLAPGAYTPIFMLDSKNQIAEADETNNLIDSNDMQVLRSDGVMIVTGTSGADHLAMDETIIKSRETYLTFDTGGPDGAQPYIVPLGTIKGVAISGLGGDDVLTLTGATQNVTLDGGDGNDRLVGGDGDDTLIGGAGKDVLDGALGNDRLNGNGGNDKLIGGPGADRLYGYDGNDYLDGGSSNDRLEGGKGVDTMLGEGGNDTFFAADGEADQIFGGSGHDSAHADHNDVQAAIESTDLT